MYISVVQSSDYCVNLAEHDAEVYRDVKVSPSGAPICPRCRNEMVPASGKESNITWNCVGARCKMIEGKFSARRGVLWDCRYEPSVMRKP